MEIHGAFSPGDSELYIWCEISSCGTKAFFSASVAKSTSRPSFMTTGSHSPVAESPARIPSNTGRPRPSWFRPGT